MRRREFIKKTAYGTTGIALATAGAGLSSCSGNRAHDKIIFALIGCGNRGIEVATGMYKADSNIAFKYVCDVHNLKANQALQIINKETGSSASSVQDMRNVFDDREVDAVIIATPEHWHALATIWACQAGKDVYVETIPGLSIWEGRKMIQAANRHKRLVQTGFQSRSAASAASALEYIRDGNLGQVVLIKTYNMLGGKKWMPLPDSEVPQGLDWNAWLGPAPDRSFNSGIYDTENYGGWKNFWAYSGGTLSVDAGHVLDLARMISGDPGHPTSVYCCGGNLVWDSEREVPEIQRITYDYGEFTISCESVNAANYMKSFHPKERSSKQQFPDWMRVSDRIEVYGTQGLMYIGSKGGGWQVIGSLDKIMAEEYDVNPDHRHFQNFMQSLRMGEKSIADVEQGHYSAALAHIGNIAYRVGNKKLIFDGAKEEFTNNSEANNLLKTSYRKGYDIPEKV